MTVYESGSTELLESNWAVRVNEETHNLWAFEPSLDCLAFACEERVSGSKPGSLSDGAFERCTLGVGATCVGVDLPRHLPRWPHELWARMRVVGRSLSSLLSTVR
ncbi:hypothetical protein [Halobaculum roseum]|uniref:Uncharacterized protein n=1 Tax=Halobaculum roseum TaxID=2175149 RepID=A0ABD5MVK9_9EURY|nr:hypothetical protein [Halobaculum roseum]QZY04573.1 hypothetical protein K6T36_16570 [Halobaculum roseum]